MMKHTKLWTAIICFLPLYGCIATGIIYIAVGVIAVLSFLKIRDGGADENSMLAVLNNSIVGQVFIWLIMVGTLCYIIWRFYETIVDPYEYGRDLKGMARRAGIALSSVADALIVYAAVRVLLGAGNIQVNGQPEEERQMVKGMLQYGWGMGAAVSLGIMVVFTAIVQLLYGVTGGYKERVDIKKFNRAVRFAIAGIAAVGYAARGIILGITGFFFIKAGLMEDASYVVNTDKAFDFIGDNVGHMPYIIVATGTVCYGLFMIAMGATYNTKKT
jgi:hypothetical protein